MVIPQPSMLLTTQMKTTKKKMSMQSDFKTISEATITEAVITTIEVTEVEQIISTQMLTEGANKPPNIGAIQTEEETPTEEIEEAVLKLSNKQQQLKISKDRNKKELCKYCKKPGHTIEDCWTLQAKNRARGVSQVEPAQQQNEDETFEDNYEQSQVSSIFNSKN